VFWVVLLVLAKVCDVFVVVTVLILDGLLSVEGDWEEVGLCWLVADSTEFVFIC
jgi:hypothetical protein